MKRPNLTGMEISRIRRFLFKIFSFYGIFFEPAKKDETLKAKNRYEEKNLSLSWWFWTYFFSYQYKFYCVFLCFNGWKYYVLTLRFKRWW